ncbi:MAG: cell division topological specificity factor MinE [Lachnospiraceae bacterium]|nr:cell division topological specificity factor MinE [Lachnospiraceae bacterium]
MSFGDFFKRKSSGETAKDRLKFVLVSDRSACSPEIMERIKNDIIDVLSKYVEIDRDGLDIKITQAEGEGVDERTGPALFANIPIRNMKQRN